MFCKKKKEILPDAFIAKPKRILAILQLCLAFSVLLWYGAQPFMGEYFRLKSQMLLYEYVMGNSELLKSPEQQEKLKRNSERFKALTIEDQMLVKNDYKIFQDYASRPTYIKILNGIKAVFWDIPAFELAWIFFSVSIAILLLLKIEGAAQAAWLLPLIVLAYAVENHLHSHNSRISPDLALFPSEETIKNDYLKEPLSPLLANQKEQLTKGWNAYLIKNWVRLPIKNEVLAIEEGEFNFTLARIQALHTKGNKDWKMNVQERLGLIQLFLYLGWNLFFAYRLNRSENLFEYSAGFA